jgi:hypothetical protein
MKTQSIIFLVVCFLIIGFCSGWLAHKPEKLVISGPGTRTVDSVKVPVFFDRVEYKNLPGKIEFMYLPEIAGNNDSALKKLNDSLRELLRGIPPFAAHCDTVIKKDTIGIKYLFPENLFSFSFRKGPDSIYKLRETVVQYVEKDYTVTVGPYFGIGYDFQNIRPSIGISVQLKKLSFQF